MFKIGRSINRCSDFVLRLVDRVMRNSILWDYTLQNFEMEVKSTFARLYLAKTLRWRSSLHLPILRDYTLHNFEMEVKSTFARIYLANFEMEVKSTFARLYLAKLWGGGQVYICPCPVPIIRFVWRGNGNLASWVAFYHGGMTVLRASRESLDGTPKAGGSLGTMLEFGKVYLAKFMIGSDS